MSLGDGLGGGELIVEQLPRAEAELLRLRGDPDPRTPGLRVDGLAHDLDRVVSLLLDDLLHGNHHAFVFAGGFLDAEPREPHDDIGTGALRRNLAVRASMAPAEAVDELFDVATLQGIND
ncbi:MAG TPA: hypothetical protein DCZ01_03755 [Elusimicrobia bacterium]|nr:hypothetical protein [Elusimicrobiota bacterium]